MWLTRLSITRPVTMLMLVLALVILGLQSNSRLPVDLYPDVAFPMLSITTVYTGTGPEEIETLITKPIEDNVSTISGLKKISSTSSEGLSTVMMEFNLGTNIDVASSDVRSKLDALRNTLPQDAKAPVVNKLDVKALPVIQINMASERRSSIDVRRLADDFLKDRLSQLPGVADVSVSGGDVREIQVKVDKSRMEAYKLNIDQVVTALQNENLNLPSGTIEEQRRNYAVRVMGEFTDPAQILNVRLSASNPNLCIRDIADVQDTVSEATTYTRVDNGPSVTLVVQKQSDANTVKVVDNVRAELEKLTGQPFTDASIAAQAGKNPPTPAQSSASSGEQLPADIHVTVSRDQSLFIKESLHDVYESLVLGALLAMLIVFLFLHSLRGTFIVALAIPTSMIATFMVMDFLGFTINMMTMMGLSLSVGILVDDSIVVMENIHRHLAMGESPRDAAINGRSEIGLAAMCITLVDVVVFVPIAFMGGIVGQFFRQFGLVVASATLFSLFVSFTLTPMLASRLLKSHDEEQAEEERQREHPGLYRRFTNAWEAMYDAFDRTYRKILAWSLDHRAVVICIGIMVMTGSIATLIAPPTLSQLAVALPVLLIGLVIFLSLWSPVAFIRSGPGRFGYTLLGLAISGVFINILTTVVGKLGIAIPTLPMMLVMALLGVLAFSLMRTPKSRGTATPGRVVTPLLAVGGLLLLIVLFVPRSFSFEFFPVIDQRQLSIKVEQDVGTTLDVTDVTTRYIEKTLKEQFPEIKTISTSVGSTASNGMSSGDSGPDIAQINVELKDYVKGTSHTTDQVILWANEHFKTLPGVKVTATFPSNGPGGAAIDIEISGDDMQRIQATATQIYDIVRKTPGVFGADLSWREGRPEVQAHIDRDRAAQYGISVSQIASALHTSMEGDTTSKYRENGKEYDIRVSLPKGERNIVSQVPNMVVGTTASGQPVYLYEVVRLEPAGGPTKVQRTNRQRSVTLTAQLAKGYALGNIQQVLQPQIAKLDTHGVTVYWAGQSEEMRDSFSSMVSALLLSVVLVFMLMAALFESLIAPLIIWLSVPQAMAGAFFALSFTGKSLNMMSMIGIIMLVGLVTKNAILLVDYTNTLRKEHGMDRKQALLQAGPTRLRPILMTTLAMIFGMLPTAIAMSKGSEMRQPMAITVIGGLLVAMFLSLLMVPSFYIIIDSLGEGFSKLLRRFGRKRRVVAEEPVQK